MRISDLLLEYNEARLLNDFGKKLELKSAVDNSAPKNKTSQQLIQVIASADPTPNKELTFWLCLNYANDGIVMWEDIDSRAVPSLLKFKALLRKPNLNPPLQVRDINQIKGLSALQDITEKYQEKETQSNSQIADQEELNFYRLKQAAVIYNGNQVKVIVPLTKEASIFFGKGTRWCTAAKNNNYFARYNKQGPLYIVIIKGTNEKYQFHYPSYQFMDSADKSINPNTLAAKYPILWKIFTPIAVKNKSLVLNWFPSEEMQLTAVKQNGLAIRYIDDPSEAVKLTAVTVDPYAIRWIKNPSEKMQLIAVKRTGNVIEFIDNPSEKVQLAAVNQNGYIICHIKNPSEKVQLAAVTQLGFAIQNIKNPSEAVKLAAVTENGYAIGYIKNPSEAVKLAAVKEDGRAIINIKNPSEAVKVAAVAKYGSIIDYIKNPSEKVQLAARMSEHPSK